MSGLSVCLLLDERTERAVRSLWGRLEGDGVRTLASYTHGRHVPHLTLASLGAADVDAVRGALAGVRAALPIHVALQALGIFTRSRCWLLPTVSTDLLRLHGCVAEALGQDVHRHYRPGAWQPHVTVAPRMPVGMLPTVASRVYEVVPLSASLTRMVLVDTGTGELHDVITG